MTHWIGLGLERQILHVLHKVHGGDLLVHLKKTKNVYRNANRLGQTLKSTVEYKEGKKPSVYNFLQDNDNDQKPQHEHEHVVALILLKIQKTSTNLLSTVLDGSLEKRERVHLNVRILVHHLLLQELHGSLRTEINKFFKSQRIVRRIHTHT